MNLRAADVLLEDLEMLERQQANLSSWPQRKLLSLNIDTGGVQARKIIERIVAAERAAHAAAVPAAA
jgi:vanillate O-demethylase monooxygenase subunit